MLWLLWFYLIVVVMFAPLVFFGTHYENVSGFKRALLSLWLAVRWPIECVLIAIELIRGKPV